MSKFINRGESAIQRPPLTLAWLEPARAIGELAALWLTAPLLMTAARGDGHPVLVLPGFSADDLSTVCLRHYLDVLGYRSTTWSLGRNFGYGMLGESEQLLRERIARIADEAGGKISLIGWSLGGVMARHMARDHPELVRQVITLAAPFTGDPAASNMRHYYEYASGDDLDSPTSREAWAANRVAPSVPTTAIYSKSDGIIAWQCCMEVETPLAENVEVIGSHLGLPHNPMALHVIADRLAQPDGGWRPYAARRD